MNYDEAIQELIDVLKADKSITQPWRNYALKAANELQAFIRMGKTVTNRVYGSPGDTYVAGETITQEEYEPRLDKNNCTCPSGGKRRTCPVHGEQA